MWQRQCLDERSRENTKIVKNYGYNFVRNTRIKIQFQTFVIYQYDGGRDVSVVL